MNRKILKAFHQLLFILKHFPQCKCFTDIKPGINAEFIDALKEVENILNAELDTFEKKVACEELSTCFYEPPSKENKKT